LFHDRGKLSIEIEKRKIVTSWLDHVPGVYRMYRNLLPLFPAAVRQWKFSGYDVVLSSSHAVAKGIDPGKALHVCYCHTPMRYIWDAAEDYEMSGAKDAAFRLFRPGLQRWDRETSKRVDHFIANSQFVAQRIEKYYGRCSEIIHPPVATRYFTPAVHTKRSDFYLAAGALTPYKRVDRTIRAFNASGRKLIVAGGGPELRRLRSIASGNVKILGRICDEDLRNLYRTAKAMVYMGREDFGMVAVEAQACGCPVIAFAEGGMAEIVDEGISGMLFPVQDETHLNRAIEGFEIRKWPQEEVHSRVESFSRESFQTKIKSALERYSAEKPARIGGSVPA
jgi:glycosyltransferase involved in cell wall biosynthesis